MSLRRHKKKSPIRSRRDTRAPSARWRVYSVIAFFALCYVAVGARLVHLSGNVPAEAFHTASIKESNFNYRPDIVDRNGRIIASDVIMQSLIADPKKVIDVDDAMEKIVKILPTLDADRVRRKLEERESRFAWVKRGVTPNEAAMIHDLGLPGFSFIDEPRRFYPAGHTAAHIVGGVDVDNRGRGGIEGYIDKIQGIYFPKLHDTSEKPPLKLSVDIGVQHIVREKIAEAIEKHRAKAGAGVLLDIETGEVVSMVSLPDYDPNQPAQALQKDRFDRIAGGTFELGSVFKTFTTAMALEIGGATLSDKFDASAPLKIDKHTIRDYHAENRPLNISEIFTHSSNIGSARLAELVGPEKHREFLGLMGLLAPMNTELGTVRPTQAPQEWRRIRSMTIAYGHGISLAPLQFAAAAAPLFNGGHPIFPTFLERSRTSKHKPHTPIIRYETSQVLKKLMRLNVEKGTAKKADVAGYLVGGKTGTAEKVVKGRYDRNKLLNTFIAIFPSDNPAYLLLVLLDEPQPPEGKLQRRPTAGVTTAPLAGAIIAQVAPMLNILPRKAADPSFDEAGAAAY